MIARLPIEITINGRPCTIEVAVNRTLLQVLRDQLGLSGSKECCLVGECGACTVLVDDRPVNSCLMLAVAADGHEVRTVEGLARNGALNVLQHSFLDKGAAQCGFCTAGQLMSAQALLEHNSDPTVAEIHEALAGNLCRCGCYFQITEAVQAAAEAARR